MLEIREEKKNDGTTIVLKGALTVASIGGIRAALLDAVRSARAIEVRLESVADIDIAFLQLLCSAHRTAANRNKPFTVSGEQEGFIELLKRSGFQRHIGCREISKHPCLWIAAPAAAR